ncbi:MAG: MarR family winged helix-turn-helix transcriptional regulator [Cyanobacteria bacterium P01_D01_bin.105]
MVSTVTDRAVTDRASASLKQQAADIAQQMSQDCVARRLRQVTRTVTRLYDEALRPHGLTVNQLNILAVVISQQHIRPGQLGQALGMEKSTVSRTIDRMVGKGWIKVTPGKDSRTQRLTVTTKGNQLLLAVTPIWDTLQAGILTTEGNSILNMLTLSEPGSSEPATSYSQLTSPEPAYTNEPISADDFYL